MKQCYRCEKTPPHTREECPAKLNTCYNCQKIGHYASVCKTKNISIVEGDGNDDEYETNDEFDAFLGAVESVFCYSQSPIFVDLTYTSL